ncbi:NADPH:quinone reductase [Nitratireductor pacificus]|uniref:Alcohol dehydrogenase n=1 Tax=Nitratireductor pacificus pht-3B TaxID=391937 RepID=K2MEM7_9HYPH|nr:NADPH:quinone reductase [Nitratireductor pacificus]EKF20586.1 alcohol dehydrogenase [Nitratireductor pacificus pht-3B]
MKAAWYERNGAARDVLKVGERPVPLPEPGEVRVRLHASGVNPSDVKSRRNRPPGAERIIPHSDGAGVIDAVGGGVDHGRIGQRVWVWNGQWRRPHGTAAEWIALPEAQAVPLPDGIDFATGACLGIPAMTAIHAVALHGDIRGRTLLVIGAGSAVGHYAVQIAKMRGARVISTASPARAAHARAAGADFVIDYKAKDVAATVKGLTGGKGADGLIDMDFYATAAIVSNGALAAHGKAVCYGSSLAGDVPVSFPTMLASSLTLQMFLVYELQPAEREAALNGLSEMLAKNSLKHLIGARYGLDEIVKAHEAVEKGEVVGNVVVEMG